MFWNMTGNANLFVESKLLERISGNSLYFLDNSKIEFPTEIQDYSDRLITAKQRYNEAQRLKVTYRYSNGKTKEILLSDIIRYQDLTNGVGSWFKGNSAIDALFKVISNSELALDGQNVNLLLTKKFMVSGKSDFENVNQPMMHDDDKKQIENKVMSEQNIHAVRSMIDIKRFVENIDKLKLPEAYQNCFSIIASMYNIPKELHDVDFENASTYENQEKAIGRHVGYTMQPKGEAFLSGLMRHFNYQEEQTKLVISWEHLPFMQVFEDEKAATNKTKAETYKILTEQNFTPEYAAALCGFENPKFNGNN